MGLFLTLFSLCAASGVAFAAARECSVYGCRNRCYSLFPVSTAFVGISKTRRAVGIFCMSRFV